MDAPVISPVGDGWQSAGTFNPAIIKARGKIVMLYRAQGRQGTSRLGYAESSDGIHFNRRDEPVLSPTESYEKNGGVEDPRLVQFGDTYYLTYTGYNKTDAQLCLATSKDLIHWERKGVIIPANKGNWNVKWTKSGAIVPGKIDGKYWMYFLGTSADKKDQGGLAYSEDLMHWTEATKTPVLPVRPGQFDSRVAEPGPAPILTEKGGSFSFTTALTTSSSTAPAWRSLIARIHENCFGEPISPSSSQKKNGRRPARCPMLYSSRAWCNAANATCSTTAELTNMWEWPRRRSSINSGYS